MKLSPSYWIRYERDGDAAPESWQSLQTTEIATAQREADD